MRVLLIASVIFFLTVSVLGDDDNGSNSTEDDFDTTTPIYQSQDVGTGEKQKLWEIGDDYTAVFRTTTEPAKVDIVHRRDIVEQFLYISFFSVMGIVAFLVIFHLFEFYHTHMSDRRRREQTRDEEAFPLNNMGTFRSAA